MVVLAALVAETVGAWYRPMGTEVLGIRETGNIRRRT
jgi:hypothetical protein